MSQSTLQALSAAILKLLRPLVRLLLRHGMPYAAFADLAKRVYVDVATDDFALHGRKQTLSRVSVITGLSRKEVRRVKGLETPSDEASQRYNRAARVIGGWVRDGRYHGAGGAPAPLPLESDEGPSFSELVREYSGDVPARAILDELLRVRAVTRLEDGRIELAARAYVPQTGEADKIGILGVDVADLISTIDHNLQCEPEDAYFQRKVSYDNLPLEGTGDLRELAGERAQLLLEELDGWMSVRDRDTNPSVEGSGRKRVSLGVYYYEEELPDDDEG